MGMDRISSTLRSDGKRQEGETHAAEGDDGLIDKVIVDRSWQNLAHGGTPRLSSDAGADSPDSSGKTEKQGTSINRKHDDVGSETRDSFL
jgi:hypothetical protein